VHAFLISTVFGIWRIGFRSLVPLIVAHMIINGVTAIPMLREQYRDADLMESLGDDFVGEIREQSERMRSNPKCRQIQELTREPAEKGVPAILEYFADPDDDVRLCAQVVLIRCFRKEGEPYLKAPLSSRERSTVQAALFVISMCGYAVYKQQVRDIAWSAEDAATQSSAMDTLLDLKDEEGLRVIAKSHPSPRIRSLAERHLGYLTRPIPANSPSPAKRPEPPPSLAPRSR
jgi:hypothetical protein